MKFSRTKLTVLAGLVATVAVTAFDLPPELEKTIRDGLSSVLFIALYFLRDSIPDKNGLR